MDINPIFLSLSIVSFIGYITSIILHKKRLKKILEIEDPIELSKAKYISQPHLALANILATLSAISILIATIFPKIPISRPYYIPLIRSYEDFNWYYTLNTFKIDVILTITLISFFGVYPLIKNQNDLVNFLDYYLIFYFFFMSFFSFLFAPLYQSLFGSMPCSMVFIWFEWMVGLTLVIGLVFGDWFGALAFEIMFALLLYLFGFLTVFGLGVGFRLFLWLFVIGCFGYITTQFRESIRAILSKWILLSIRFQEAIDLGKHESIPEIEDEHFRRYLKKVVIDYLTASGFTVDGIKVHIDRNVFKEWNDNVVFVLEELKRGGRISKLDVKEISKKCGLSELQVMAVLTISDDPRVKQFVRLRRAVEKLGIKIDPCLLDLRTRLFSVALMVPKSVDVIAERLGISRHQLGDLINLVMEGSPGAMKIAERFNIHITRKFVEEVQRKPQNVLLQIAVVDYAIISLLIRRGYIEDSEAFKKVRRVFGKEDLVELWITDRKAFSHYLRTAEGVPLHVVVDVLREYPTVVNVLPIQVIKKLIVAGAPGKEVVLRAISGNKTLILELLTDSDIIGNLSREEFKSLLLAADTRIVIERLVNEGKIGLIPIDLLKELIEVDKGVLAILDEDTLIKLKEVVIKELNDLPFEDLALLVKKSKLVRYIPVNILIKLLSSGVPLSEEIKERIFFEVIQRGEPKYISGIPEAMYSDFINFIEKKVGIGTWIDEIARRGGVEQVPVLLLGKLLEKDLSLYSKLSVSVVRRVLLESESIAEKIMPLMMKQEQYINEILSDVSFLCDMWSKKKELLKDLISVTANRDWFIALASKGRLIGLPFELVVYVINLDKSLLKYLPVEMLKQLIIEEEGLRSSIITLLKTEPDKTFEILVDIYVVNRLSEDEFYTLLSVVNMRKWLHYLILDKKIHWVKLNYVMDVIERDPTIVFELLTDLRKLMLIPEDIVQRLLSVVDVRQLLYKVMSDENRVEILEILLKADSDLLSRVSVDELAKMIYNLSVDAIVELFGLIPWSLSYVCYVRLKEYLGGDWIYRVDEELGNKNGDLAFLVSLFGVLDFRVSEVRLILNSFKAEIKNEDIRKIKEFIEGVRKLSEEEISELIGRIPQLGLWVAAESPELLRGKVAKSLSALLKMEPIRKEVLDYLLSLGSFITAETLLYMYNEVRSGGLELKEAVALAGKEGRPYEYKAFRKVRSIADFEKALLKLGVIDL